MHCAGGRRKTCRAGVIGVARDCWACAVGNQESLYLTGGVSDGRAGIDFDTGNFFVSSVALG